MFQSGLVIRIGGEECDACRGKIVFLKNADEVIFYRLSVV